MVFTNPILLAGLAAIGIPIAIHLLFREKPQPVDIPTVEFIRRATLKSRRRQRITQMLLLLTRIAIIVLLVLVVTRPIWNNSPFYQATTGHAALVVIIDDSFYTEQTVEQMPLIDQAHAMAHDCINRLAHGSKATCFTTSQATDQLTADLDFVRRLIDQTAPRTTRGSLRRAINQAGALLNRDAGDLRKSIVVISDFNRSMLGNADEALPTPEGCRLILLNLPKRTNNVYIRSAALERPDNIIVNRPARLHCQLGGGELLKDQRLVLELDGNVAHQATIERIDATGSATVSFDVGIGDAGFAAAELRIETVDALDSDNNWYLTLRATNPANVLCVGNLGSDFQQRDLIAAAIAPPGWYGRQRYTIALANDEYGWNERQLGDYELILLSGRCGFPNSIWLRLQDYVRNGGNLLVMPDATTDLERLNAGALPMLPGKLTRHGDAKAEPQQLSAADNAELGARLLAIGNGELTTVQPTQYYDIAVDAESATELMAGKHVVIASRQVGEGRVLVCGLSTEPGWSPLVRRDVFAPYIHALLGSFGANDRSRRATICGDPVRIPPLLSSQADGATIRLPGGSNEVHLAAADFDNGDALFSQTSEPGVYVVSPEASDSFQFAANIYRNDGTYQYDDMTALIDNTDIGTHINDILAESTQSRGPAPLNPALLVLLILLLTAETYLGLQHRRHARA